MARTPSAAEDEIFNLRLARSAPDLFPMLETLYGARPDYPAFREKLLKALKRGWSDRPADLKRLDLQRDDARGELDAAALHLRDSLHKGDPVVLGGRLTSQRWLNEAGVQQLSLEIDAEWVGHDLRRGTSSFARVRQRDADAPNETEWDAERRAAEEAADEQRIDERSEVVAGV